MRLAKTVPDQEGTLFVVRAAPARDSDPGGAPLNLGLDAFTALWRLASGRRRWRVTVHRWPADREAPQLHELVPSESAARARFSELIKEIEASAWP